MPKATLFLVGFLQPSAAEESRLNAMLRAFSRSFQESRSAPRSALVVLAAIVAVALVATLAWRALERWQSRAPTPRPSRGSLASGASTRPTSRSCT